MNDIALELAKLHTLKGADYSRQVERIARMGVFHPIEGEPGIYSVGGESSDDYGNLLNAARKAVAHGYKVYILPNPYVTCSPDFIFERKGVFSLQWWFTRRSDQELFRAKRPGFGSAHLQRQERYFHQASLCFPERFRQEVSKGIREIKNGGCCQPPSLNFGAGAV